jgi:hypothetical protein
MKNSLNPKDFSNVLATALYSASVEERETVGCFLEFHKIRFEPRKTQWAPMERLPSGQPTKSTSE